MLAIAGMAWPSGWQVVRTNGIIYIVNVASVVDRNLALWGEWEADQIAYLKEMMRRHGCDIFLDVGANIGLYSLEMARGRLAGRIVALEPDPRSFHRLSLHAQINNAPIEIHNVAASAAAARLRFKLYDLDNPGRSQIVAEGGDMMVSCVPVDSLLDVEGRTIFGKIDVEGHEKDVLGGMAALAARNRLFLQVECFAEGRAAILEAARAIGLSEVARIGDDVYLANWPA